MIAPSIIAFGYKAFTDCETYNDGNYGITSIPVPVLLSGGYSGFRDGDVAIALSTYGCSPSGSGWTKIVDGTELDIYTKRYTGTSDSFATTWSAASANTLWSAGIFILVYRSPYQSDALFYYNTILTQSSTASSPTVTLPANARTAFDDSNFYYRLEACWFREQTPTYNANSFGYAGANTNLISTSNCENNSAYFNAPAMSLGFSLFPSSNLSGTSPLLDPAVYYAPSSPTVTFTTVSMWLRGSTGNTQGMIL